MSGAQLVEAGDGSLRVTGPLRFATVSALVDALPARRAALRVDLAAVDAVDSAGLALLVEWQRRAQVAGTRLELAHAPAQLRRLAELGGVATLLGLSQADSEPPS